MFGKYPAKFQLHGDNFVVNNSNNVGDRAYILIY